MTVQPFRRRAIAGVVALCTMFTLPAVAGPAVANGPAPGELVARDRDGRLWVHPATGDPTRPWDPAVRRLAGSGWQAPNVLALADVSLDGKPDLFTRDPAGDGTVGYHATRSDAAWDPAVRVLGMAGWNNAASVLVEDVDQDGRPDLLARQSGGNLRVWPHDGKTTASPWLTPAYDVAEGLERTDVVAFGEITGDGLRDLVIREDDGSVWVLPHPGVVAASKKRTARWTWQKPARTAKASADPAAPYSAGVGWADDTRLDFQDVNGDGLADLLATDRSGQLRVALHTGAPAGENPWPAAIPVGDFSAYDVVAVSPVARKQSVVRISPRAVTTAAGATTAYRATLVSPSGSRDVTNEVTWSTSDPAVARIDAGGRATALASGNSAVTASLAGAAVGAAGLRVSGGTAIPPVRPGDAVGLDRDGRLWHYPYSGDPLRPWSRTTRRAVGVDWAGPDRLLLSDLTLDGALDLFVRAPSGDGSVWFHPHSAADPLRPWSPTSKVFGMSGWNNAAAVLLEDLNGDRRPDLLSRMPAGNLRVWFHDGKTTASPWLTPGNWTDVATGLQTTDIVRFGDITGDGLRDLLIREQDGAVWVLPNPGTSRWTWNPATADPNPTDPAKPYRLGATWSAATTLDLQDINADGRPDLLTTTPAGALTLTLHNNNPRAPYTTPTTLPGTWTDRLLTFTTPERNQR
ncbi:hypothetical protein HPO96_36725 [Kribbella sandramycini]|uniref:BIG2 domain-containing protein n=1 Tax=Kribbella sandramycini TaxID=60450 RepID=A0A7Y4L7I1_9ACTN|nr:FG-GAP-like repeat-containing protein [Kribbella sandramycini]MBB6570279.1 hypothetical protein [Kribbella sandramycini]NOL45803.1 hypothetical protein [Kribbella sandramycini]